MKSYPVPECPLQRQVPRNNGQPTCELIMIFIINNQSKHGSPGLTCFNCTRWSYFWAAGVPFYTPDTISTTPGFPLKECCHGRSDGRNPLACAGWAGGQDGRHVPGRSCPGKGQVRPGIPRVRARAPRRAHARLHPDLRCPHPPALHDREPRHRHRPGSHPAGSAPPPA